MRSPLRMMSAWIDHQRLFDRCNEVEWQVGVSLRKAVSLVPIDSGGGADRIFMAMTRVYPETIAACVRINCPWRQPVVAEPHLPRRSLSPRHRILRESHVYERLAPLGIAPALIARGEYFLANEYVPWPRVSEVLKRSPEVFWTVLPRVLSAVRRMHDAGVVHLDLNCGNLLISPNYQSVFIIDFEYAPPHDMILFDQQRFDYLRLAHSLLQPRRGRAAAIREPGRFVDLFALYAPESGYGVPELLNTSCFNRVLENETIRRGFQDLLGVIEPLAAVSPRKDDGG